MNKIIGITGIIGSGKTTLMNLLRKELEKEYEFIDVDIYRRNLINNNNNEILKILNLDNIDDLNKNIYKDLKKMKLFKEYLYKNLIHDLLKINKPIIIEWALLIDDDLDKYCDYIFLLDSSEEVVISRLKDGDLDINEIKKRIKLQLSVKEKVELLKNDNYQVIDSNKKIKVDSIIKKIKEVSYEL